MKKKIIIFIYSLLLFCSFLYSKTLIDVASSRNHTLFLFENGSLFAFGSNFYGQLGINTDVDTSKIIKSPTFIQTEKKFISVAAGFKHSLAVAEDGTLWGWGDNNNHQLGKLNYKNISSPVEIDEAQDWVKVFFGGYESLGLKEDGTIWKLNDNTKIDNPNNCKWINASLHADIYGSDYLLCVVLEDEDGAFWTYGSAVEELDDLCILNSFADKKDNFFEISLLKLSKKIQSFQSTYLNAVYQSNNKLVIIGLSSMNTRKISTYWDFIQGKNANNYLVKNKKYFSSKHIKKCITGTFSDYMTFIKDYSLDQIGNNFYSYTAILKDTGQVEIWSNGKRLQKKKLCVKNIFGGKNLIIQTEDDKIYGVGYFTNINESSDILDYIPFEIDL